MFCVGCGDDITHKAANRRSLLCAASKERVVPAWKVLFEQAFSLKEPDVDIDTENITGSGRICRKCFAAFDRYHSLQASLLDNLKKAIDVLEPTSLGTKRPRLETSCLYLPIQQTAASTSSSESPTVAVCLNHMACPVY